MALHPEVQALLSAMRELQSHLEPHDTFWAQKVQIAADEVARSDGHGVARFLAYFGGMGSLNDLVLQRDGKMLFEENYRIQPLLQLSYDLAHALRHEAS